MLENDESFIYIKNDEEVNLKTDRFNTEQNLLKLSLQNPDISDAQILSVDNEIHQKNISSKTLGFDNKNYLLLEKSNPNSNYVHNRNGSSYALKNANSNINIDENYTNKNNFASVDTLKTDKSGHKSIKFKHSYIEEQGPKIISLDDVPRFRRLFIQVHPFILNGYRIHHEIRDCFLSVFKLHNETLNIWTHLLPFIGFLVLLTYLFISKYK